ncbi:hypothetical protein ACVLD2_002139 [Paenibacillus sp. PvR052]
MNGRNTTVHEIAIFIPHTMMGIPSLGVVIDKYFLLFINGVFLKLGGTFETFHGDGLV